MRVLKLKFVRQPIHPAGTDLISHYRGKKDWTAQRMGLPILLIEFGLGMGVIQVRGGGVE